MVRPAATRRKPPCPVADRCGGCQWQQLPYAQQLDWKEQLYRDTLVRRCSVDPALLLPIVAADDEWNYRSRTQIKCRLTREGFVCGFFAPKSHYVVPMDRCPVLAEPLNDLLDALRELLAASVFAADVPQMDLALADCRRRRAVIHYHGSDLDGLLALLQQGIQDEQLDLLVQPGPRGDLLAVFGSGELTLQVDDPPLFLTYAAGGFAQINLDQNRRLLDSVVAAARLTGNERVLDLYCGMGNFSLPLARRAKQVCGIEDYAPSITMARRNAIENRIENVQFHARPAEGALAEFSREGSFDLLVLDPPRAGAFALMDELLTQPVGRVIYVSCDAQTLARDLALLLAGGYRLISSQPFDLFPQTCHVESLTVLEYTG